VDGRLVWTGGRNFSRCAFFRDHDLTFVLDGPLVGQMQQRFDAYWDDQGGQTPAADVARAQAAEAGDERNAVGARSPDRAPPANRLLRAGIRVYLYPGMTHVKAVVVDGVWAYLGTGNLDPLSLRHNYELGLAISAGPVIADLERRLFLEDMRPEYELIEPLPLSFHDWLCEWVASICL